MRILEPVLTVEAVARISPSRSPNARFPPAVVTLEKSSEVVKLSLPAISAITAVWSAISIESTTSLEVMNSARLLYFKVVVKFCVA